MASPIKTREEMMEFPGPAIVLTDNLFSFIAFRIRMRQPVERALGLQKKRVYGYYNHAMWLIKPGRVVSQDWRLKERSLGDYLDGRHRVKVVYGRGWTLGHNKKLLRRLERDVIEDGVYDWLGIIGQLLRIPRFNFPHRFFCSEHVASVLQEVHPSFPYDHPSPAQINQYTKENQDYFEVFGVFSPYGD